MCLKKVASVARHLLDTSMALFHDWDDPTAGAAARRRRVPIHTGEDVSLLGR